MGYKKCNKVCKFKKLPSRNDNKQQEITKYLKQYFCCLTCFGFSFALRKVDILYLEQRKSTNILIFLTSLISRRKNWSTLKLLWCTFAKPLKPNCFRNRSKCQKYLFAKTVSFFVRSSYDNYIVYLLIIFCNLAVILNVIK